MRLKYFIAPFIGLSIALPILALIVYFIFQSDFSFGLLNNQELLDYLKNTSLLTIGTFIAVVFLGTISAFLNARFEYTGSKFFGFAFILPLAYPAYIIGYTYVGFFEYRGILAEVLNMNIKLDILNMYGAIFIFGISMYAYVYILARVSFASVSSTVAELISLQKMSSIKA